MVTGAPRTWPAGHAQLEHAGGGLLAHSMTGTSPGDGFPSGPLRANAVLVRGAGNVAVLENTEGLSLHVSPQAGTLGWSQWLTSGAVRSPILAHVQSPPGALELHELPVPGGVAGLPESEVTPFRLYTTDLAIAWAPPVRQNANSLGGDYWTTPTWFVARRDRLPDASVVSAVGLHSVLGFDAGGRLMVARADSPPVPGAPIRIEFLDDTGTVIKTLPLPICDVEGTARNWRCEGRPSEVVRELHIWALIAANQLFFVTFQRFAGNSAGVVLWSDVAEVVAQPADIDVHVSGDQLVFLERDAQGVATAARWDPQNQTMVRRECGPSSGARCFATRLGAVVVRELGEEEILDRYGLDVDASRTTAAAYLRPFESDEERLLGDLCPLSESPERCAEGPAFLPGQTPGLAFVSDQDDVLFAIERPGGSRHVPDRRLLRLD